MLALILATVALYFLIRAAGLRFLPHPESAFSQIILVLVLLCVLVLLSTANFFFGTWRIKE